ncbi:MAG: DUF3667 domain-containing protein [Bacteroidia bacterium]
MNSNNQHNQCLNCNYNLPANAKYCSNCGQKTESPIIGFKDFIKDALEDYFSIDSKIFKSILPLLFKPGFLTIEYIKGKRNTYIPPFRMFLIVSVLYFLLLSLLEEKNDFIKVHESQKEVTSEKNIDTAKKEEVSIKFDRIGDTKMALVMLKLKDSTEQAYISKYGLKAYIDSVFADENIFYRFLSRKLYAMYLTDGENFGELMFRSFQKLVFVMAPIMAFILLLIYYRNKIYYMQHLIFALHFHAFVFLMMLFDDSLLFIVGNWSSILITIAILLYLYLAIKKVYQENRIISFLKFIILFLGYILIGIPILVILTVASAILLY